MSGAERMETSFYLGEIKYKTFEVMFFNEQLFKNYLFSEKFQNMIYCDLINFNFVFNSV